MTDEPIYCIDTSSLLDGRRRIYPPDHFIQLWRNIEDLIERGRLMAPEEVRVELSIKDDETFAWAKNRQGLFVLLDSDQIRETTLITNRFPRFVDNPKARNRADPFVIALAKARGLTVVTQERPGSPDSPKMPTVCAHFQVRYIRFLDIIRQEQWRF